ncbi:hypothetical protein [Burkholderia gladioli]|uniref:hypothetical protein n=1 Tax=Burkholderia gladioli TaxID=28095 RepID=UPI0016422322|nr:hypothetical protein [Burkholderia gladioli]MBU9385104.1 hypothetical protein [Burkholderia gladioli]
MSALYKAVVTKSVIAGVAIAAPAAGAGIGSDFVSLTYQNRPMLISRYRAVINEASGMSYRTSPRLPADVGVKGHTWQVAASTVMDVWGSLVYPVAQTASQKPSSVLDVLDGAVDPAAREAAEHIFKKIGVTSLEFNQRYELAKTIAGQKNIRAIKLATADAPGVFSNVTVMLRLALPIDEIYELNLKLTREEVERGLRGSAGFEIAYARAHV